MNAIQTIHMLSALGAIAMIQIGCSWIKQSARAAVYRGVSR